MLWACVFGGGLCQAADELRLVTTLTPEQRAFHLGNSVLIEACRRAGLQLRLQDSLPDGRAQAMLEAGTVDGDLARDLAFSRQLPQAIRIEPAYAQDHYLAIGLAHAPRADNWAALSDRRIAYLRDAKFVTENTRHIAFRRQVNDYHSCLNLILNGKVDVCIAAENSISNFLDQAEYKHQLNRLGILASVDVYLFLAPNRQALADRLRNQLAVMQALGEFEKFRQAALSQDCLHCLPE
ncbi:substrate-binding periplasmic protein [Parachitinimonas caeni]|uniref:Transporter substrate-binding domain-containing protein n=1 Tax=Parachitinimonas caeni TaxID=3031301 RepID=A0ABT7E5V9_9NEIS|nr:transporter substrate-binding domain-containing protein [Parachitinimonas caeni]MDK2126743.1 transporter substrate-binding domain-containing protein [Parachitinimonas caeni]